MNDSLLHCRNCGATPRAPSRLGACEFCGVELPHEPEPTPRVTSARSFADLERHPEYESWLRTIPPALATGGHKARGSRGALVFALVAGVLFLSAARSGGARATVPFVVCFGILAIVLTRRRARRSAPEPTRAFGSRIVDERTLVQTMGHTSVTRYFVTLEERAGNRVEYPVDGKTAGKLTRDDLGVAYVRDETLVAFQRIL